MPIKATISLNVFERIPSKLSKARLRASYKKVPFLTSVSDNCKANDRQMSFWLHTVGYSPLLEELSLRTGKIYYSCSWLYLPENRIFQHPRCMVLSIITDSEFK